MTETKIYKKIIIFLVILFGTMWVTSCASQGVTSIEDGVYNIDITMEGGSGKAYIKSPVEVTVKDGEMTAAHCPLTKDSSGSTIFKRKKRKGTIVCR